MSKQQSAPIEVETQARATMGDQTMIEYAVFRAQARYLPHKGRALGVTSADLDLFWAGLTKGFELARSSNRTQVDPRRIVVYEYTGHLGHSEPLLRDSVKVVEPENAQSFADVKTSVTIPSGFDGNVYVWADGALTKNGAPADHLPNDPARRWYAVILIECVRSNPNGDPDNGGKPRILNSGHGMISYASIKRVVRDYAAEVEGEKLHIARGADLGAVQDAYVDQGVGAFRKAHVDVRLFGGVHPRFKGAERSCGSIQMEHAVSVNRVNPTELGITRVAGMPKKKGADAEGGAEGGAETEGGTETEVDES